MCDIGRKRSAPDDASTRPAKTTKTGAGRAKGKTGPKVVLSFSLTCIGSLLVSFKGQSNRQDVQVSSSPASH